MPSRSGESSRSSSSTGPSFAHMPSRNLIHASDSFGAATTEIGLWFAKDELADYKVSDQAPDVVLVN